MNSVIIFDVSSFREEVIRMMHAKGYYKDWNASEKRYFLPENIVWKPNTESQQAMNDLESVIEQINSYGKKCELLRCVVLNSSPWKAIVGVPTT